MSSQTDQHNPIPEGYGTATPWVITDDTPRLIDFVTKAFDAIELARLQNEDGRIGHAEVRIGDSVVMMFDSPKGWPETPAFLRLYVADADATHSQALAAGATSVTEVTELFWGDRVGRVRDPLGNVWWIQERAAELDPDEIQRRAAQPEFADAMRYVQSTAGTALSHPDCKPPTTPQVQAPFNRDPGFDSWDSCAPSSPPATYHRAYRTGPWGDRERAPHSQRGFSGPRTCG